MGWSAWHWASQSAQPAPVPAPVEALELSVLPMVGIDQLQERPLFHRSRLPVREAPAAAAPAVVQTLPPVLLGIVRQGTEVAALLQGSSGERARLVHVGQPFDDWQLTAIRARRVTLARDGQTLELALQSASPGVGLVPPSSSSSNGTSP
jgi:hypothetical protein